MRLWGAPQGNVQHHNSFLGDPQGALRMKATPIKGYWGPVTPPQDHYQHRQLGFPAHHYALAGHPMAVFV